LTADDLAAVQLLADNKYRTWEWNIGSSPAYGYRMTKRFPFGNVDVRLSVEDGVIREAHIFGDFFGVLEIAGLETRLIGVRHERKYVREALDDLDVGGFIHGITTEEFCGLF